MIFSEELLDFASNLQRAKSDWQRAKSDWQRAKSAFVVFFDEWAASVPTMGEENFWRHANRLRVIYNKQKNYERAIKTFLREAYFEGKEKFSEAAQFAISYWRYLELVQDKCKGVSQGWNRPFVDDIPDEDLETNEEGTVGDLIEAIPLAGEEVFTKLLEGRYFVTPNEIDIKELEKDIRENAPSSAGKILNRCHFIAETLHEELCEYLCKSGPGHDEAEIP